MLAAGARALAVGVVGVLAAGAVEVLVLAEAAVPFVLAWLAGTGWAAGCSVATVPWTAWVAPRTTPLAAEAVAGGDDAWGTAPDAAPDAVVVAAAGAPAAGVLDAGVLAGDVLAGVGLWTAVPVPRAAVLVAEAAALVAGAAALVAGAAALVAGAAVLVAGAVVLVPACPDEPAAAGEATDDTANEADDTASPAT